MDAAGNVPSPARRVFLYPGSCGFARVESHRGKNTPRPVPGTGHRGRKAGGVGGSWSGKVLAGSAGTQTKSDPLAGQRALETMGDRIYQRQVPRRRHGRHLCATQTKAEVGPFSGMVGQTNGMVIEVRSHSWMPLISVGRLGTEKRLTPDHKTHTDSCLSLLKSI